LYIYYKMPNKLCRDYKDAVWVALL